MLRKLTSRANTKCSRSFSFRRLGVESLEDRRLMAVDLASYVANLNFDDFDALPQTLGEMVTPGQTVNDWFQFTQATTDYLHTDPQGYLGEGSDTGTITAPPEREGFIAVAVDNSHPLFGNYYEYAGQFALFDFGVEYALDIHVGTAAADGDIGGAFEGEIVIFGIPKPKEEGDIDLEHLRSTFNEFTHTLIPMQTVPIDQEASTWQKYSNITFTPTDEMQGIVIGVRTEQDSAYVLIDAESSSPKVTEITIDGPGSFHAPYNFSTVDGSVACSPKPDPCVMRVPSVLRGKETLDERQEAQSGADHQEAA